MAKIIRTATVPSSLDVFCRGLLAELRQQGYDVVALSSPGPELEHLARREGVQPEAVVMHRDISPLADLRSLWRLYRTFRRLRPDMVHSMTPKAGLLSMMAAWMARVPRRVHTFTGLIFPTATGFRRFVLATCDKVICACATHIIPEGEGVRNDLSNNGITSKPMRVLGFGNIRGIDLDHYRRTPEIEAEAKNLRRQYGFDDSATVFIFIGRLVADKGVSELVDAFGSLNRDDVRLLLLGDEEASHDPLPEATRQAITNNPNIISVPWQQDVRPWLVASDALVLPSYREGFPNVVIESCAMDIPAVVTDINGSREIISDGSNGLIVPPRDAAALSKAMLRIIENPSERLRMAKVARASVAERFEQSFVRSCLYKFYKEILAD